MKTFNYFYFLLFKLSVVFIKSESKLTIEIFNQIDGFPIFRNGIVYVNDSLDTRLVCISSEPSSDPNSFMWEKSHWDYAKNSWGEEPYQYCSAENTGTQCVFRSTNNQLELYFAKNSFGKPKEANYTCKANGEMATVAIYASESMTVAKFLLSLVC